MCYDAIHSAARTGDMRGTDRECVLIEKGPETVPNVSVIIPTFNRANLLARVLPSYLASPVVKEVLVVDDGSQDGTLAVVERFFEADPRVQLVRHEHNLGRTYARNTGIEQSQSDLLLFSEDDLELDPPSLEILVQHLEVTGADIIAGRRIWMRRDETRQEALARADGWRGPVVNTRLWECFSHATTPDDVALPLVDATMLVRREVTEKVRFAGCFPGNAWREESDFQLAAQERGFRVFFCPHSVCFHHERSVSERGVALLRRDLVDLYWIFRNNLTFLRRHRAYLREHIPESLVLGSPLLTSLIYLPYRAARLLLVEARRAWHGFRQPQKG